MNQHHTMKIETHTTGFSSTSASRGCPAIQLPDRFKSAVALALAGLLAAFSAQPAARAADGADTPAPANPTPEAVSATPVPEAHARLLQAGAEPRKALRLHPKPGVKRTSTMTLKMGMEVQAGGNEGQPMKLPPIKMVMDTNVKSVSPEGDITYDMVMSDLTVADDPDALPQMVEAIKTAMGGLKGVSVAGTMSNRGISKSIEAKTPADATPQARQTIEQMKDSFCNTGVVLPQEAIGPGAKWEVKQKVKSQGMTLDQTTVYELVSIDGDHFNAKTTMSQTAANQAVENPAMQGMKMDLVRLSTKGTGEATVDLGQFAPTLATMDMRTESTMTMNMGDQKTDMSMKMNIGVRMETTQ
jgi:hypothetical protein